MKPAGTNKRSMMLAGGCGSLILNPGIGNYLLHWARAETDLGQPHDLPRATMEDHDAAPSGAAEVPEPLQEVRGERRGREEGR